MWEGGRLSTDEGELICYPGMTVDEFRSTEIGSHGDVLRSDAAGWAIWIKGVKIDGLRWNIIANFLGSRLDLLLLGLAGKDRQQVLNEADGPDAEIDALVGFYRQWLRRHFGQEPRASCSWGLISAGFDERSWNASIAIRYRYDDTQTALEQSGWVEP